VLLAIQRFEDHVESPADAHVGLRERHLAGVGAEPALQRLRLGPRTPEGFDRRVEPPDEGEPGLFGGVCFGHCLNSCCW